MLKGEEKITTVAVLTATIYHEREEEKERDKGVIISDDLS